LKLPDFLALVEWAMAHIEGADRSQVLLLPEAVDDYVGSDNPVRFIDAFVNELDLVKAGFVRARPKETGRPGYHPGDLLKLYIYGYLNRIRSSRRLEAEAHRNIEVIWLLRRLRPDFKTIADFRRENRAAFKKVFREFVLLCRRLDLFGRELIAVDGTRIKAVNSRDRNFTKAKLERELQASDERLSRYLAQLDEADKDDDGGPSGASVEKLQEKIEAIKERKERLAGYREELEQSGKDQLSLTDPDSRSMHPGTGVGVGYNIQIAVDAKHKLIVEQQVHSKVSDLGLLIDETADAARENLAVEQLDAVADRGYYKIEDIEACEAAGITPYVPKPRRSTAAHSGHFPKDRFHYDAEADAYICPGGECLTPRSHNRCRDTIIIDYYNRAACGACGLRSQCTKKTYRRIARYQNEAMLERMAERLKARPEIVDARREIVEHPFGSIKQWMHQGAFLMRRLENVRGEFSLTALAYNIRRAITLVGIPALIGAVRA
jgi:transposase